MAKAGKSTRTTKGTGIAQRHIHSRISYLYQAAIYLENSASRVEDRPLRTSAAAEDDPVRFGGAGESNAPVKLECKVLPNGIDQSKPEASGKNARSQKHSQAVLASSTETHHLLASMRSISHKTQIRLSRSIKRSVCRRCNGLLLLNSIAEMENLSRGGRKVWADVLVVKCSRCDFVKRYPVGMGEARKSRTKQRAGCIAAAAADEISDDAKSATGS